MERSHSSGSGVAKLLAEIKPRWTRERHERVFAAIVERIRAEAEDQDGHEDGHEGDEHDRGEQRPGAGDVGYGQYESGHTHA